MPDLRKKEIRPDWLVSCQFRFVFILLFGKGHFDNTAAYVDEWEQVRADAPSHSSQQKLPSKSPEDFFSFLLTIFFSFPFFTIFPHFDVLSFAFFSRFFSVVRQSPHKSGKMKYFATCIFYKKTRPCERNELAVGSLFPQSFTEFHIMRCPG